MTPQRRAATMRFILDIICVVIFVIIGRRNHNETTDAIGTLRTAAPFLIALLGAWVGAKAWRAPRTLSTGSRVVDRDDCRGFGSPSARLW